MEAQPVASSSDVSAERDKSQRLKPSVFELKKSLPLEDQAKFVKSVLKTPGRYLNKDDSDYYITDLDFNLIDFIQESKNPEKLMSIVVDHVFQNSDKYNYNLSAQGGINGRNSVDFLVEAIAGQKFAMLNAMRGLETKSPEETRKIVGMLVDNAGYVEVLNNVRAQLRESEESQFLRIGRILMCQVPLSLHTSSKRAGLEISV